MFFNLMSKTTHLVFRQNRSRKHIAFAPLYFCSSLPIRASNGTGFSSPAGQPRDRREKRVKNYNFWKKKKKFDNFWLFFDIFFANQIVLLSRDVPRRDGTACLKSLYYREETSLKRPGLCKCRNKSCTIHQGIKFWWFLIRHFSVDPLEAYLTLPDIAPEYLYIP